MPLVLKSGQTSTLASTIEGPASTVPWEGCISKLAKTAWTAAGRRRYYMNAVSGEGLNPPPRPRTLFIPTSYICSGTLREIYPTKLHKNVYGCAVHVMARHPSYPVGAHRVSLIILSARRPRMDLEVGGHLRRRQRRVPPPPRPPLRGTLVNRT